MVSTQKFGSKMKDVFLLVAFLSLFLAPLAAFAVLFVILSVIPSSLSSKSIEFIDISIRGFFMLISVSAGTLILVAGTMLTNFLELTHTGLYCKRNALSSIWSRYSREHQVNLFTVRYEEIDAVRFRQNKLQKMLRVGTIIIECRPSSRYSTLYVKNIDKPDEVLSAIQKCIRKRTRHLTRKTP